jgi:hypothetical protein
MIKTMTAIAIAAGTAAAMETGAETVMGAARIDSVLARLPG